MICLIHIVFLNVFVASVHHGLLPFPVNKFEALYFLRNERCLALLQLCSRTVKTSVRRR